MKKNFSAIIHYSSEGGYCLQSPFFFVKEQGRYATECVGVSALMIISVRDNSLVQSLDATENVQ